MSFSREMGASKEGFKQGLEAAAVFLKATADDYDQMANQKAQSLKCIHPLSQGPGNQVISELRSKATLLRGQAGHILKLKP